MRPTFSVCVPIRNEATWISGAIESVLAQSYGDFELIIGDNASTDALSEVVAGFDDPRVRVRHFQDPVPVNESFNRAAGEARNGWIIPLSADDRMRPGCLQRLADEIETYDDQGVVMVVAAVRRVNAEGEPDDIGARDERQQRPFPYRPTPAGLHDAASWLIENAHPGIRPYMPSSIAFRRATVVASGFFRPDMALCADGELVLRMAAYGPVAYIDEVVVDYTVRGDSASNRFVLEDLRQGNRMTMAARAWEAAIRVHADRREITDEEWAARNATLARSHLQRAVYHRRMETGRGRRAALADVSRALRYSPRALASPLRARDPVRHDPRADVADRDGDRDRTPLWRHHRLNPGGGRGTLGRVAWARGGCIDRRTRRRDGGDEHAGAAPDHATSMSTVLARGRRGVRSLRGGRASARRPVRADPGTTPLQRTPRP